MIEGKGNNRIMIKNTIYLYFRMIISLCISLYTSRAFLEALGVEDYGIYNVVGGFVAILSVLTCSITSAAQRFITFAIGKGDVDTLKRTFSSFSTMFIIVAFFILIVGVIIGEEFLDKLLNLPIDRITAAHFVYHCSLFTFTINLIAIPYNACIIAHERMDFYAFVSIGESVFKLLIVYLLYITIFDRLYTYAILLCILSIVVRLVYGFYCKKNFIEASTKFMIDKKIFKEVFSYSTWVLLGASSAVLKEQGVNVVINTFYGVAMNAARGISMQVYGVINQFVNSIGTAISPQITKSYASNNVTRSISLTFLLVKVQVLLLIFLSTPLIVEADYILNIWLKNVPEYAVKFTQFVLLLCIARTFHNSLVPLFLATGKVKWVQICSGGFMLLNLPISYLVLWLGGDPVSTMIVGICMELICMTIVSFFLQNYIRFRTTLFFFTVVAPLILVGGFSLFVSYIVSLQFDISFYRFIFVCFVSTASLSLCAVSFVFKKSERAIIFEYLKQFLFRKHK